MVSKLISQENDKPRLASHMQLGSHGLPTTVLGPGVRDGSEEDASQDDPNRIT